MPTLDAAQVECLIFTYKEGLLSAVAHDLKLKASKLSFDISASSVTLRVDAASLKVVCARKDDRDAPGLLSDKDFAKIERNIREDVLESARNPEIVFRSSKVETVSEGHVRVSGSLTLHGQSRPLTLDARRVADRWTGEVRLHQPDFGIKPYSAMLGTLKVQADIKITVSVNATVIGV